MVVSKTELAGLLGVSGSTLNTYIKKGMLGKVGSGPATKYDLQEALQFHIAEQVKLAIADARKAAPDLQGIPDIETSEAILAHWRAEREKNRTLRDANELVTIAESEKEIAFRLTQVRNALDTIPATWAPFIIAMSTVEQAQKQLNEQLQLLYQSLSNLPDDDIDEVLNDDISNDDDSDD
jgi:hypothetical protein